MGQEANNRATHSLIIALLVAAVIFILRQVWEVAYSFADIILLFGIAWLVAFIISPITNYLSRHPIPRLPVRYLRQRDRVKWADRLDTFRLPHAVAVILVYFLVLLGLATSSVFAVPALVAQLLTLGQSVPKLIQLLPDLLISLQRELAVWGIEIDLATLSQPAALAQRAEALSAEIVQAAFTLATGLASLLVNTLLVLTLSLYMSLDGPRLARQLHTIIPDHYHGQVNLVGQSISRTFGGFIRGQLLIAFLYGFPAAVLMAVAGIGLAAVVGTISGLLMLVPLVGAPIAMLLPGVTALIQAPHNALWLFIVMSVYQQVLLHALAPKVMGDVLGMPPLLVLLAMMASMRLVGFWGLVFGIPLAGVIYALGLTYLEQAKIRREGLLLPHGTVEDETTGAFRLPAVGPGCLLIPDIEGSSTELRPFAQYLSARGITSLCLQPYRELGETMWEDWYAAILMALDQLWRDCNQVFIAGEGVGAALALHAASELPIAAVGALALPLTRDGLYRNQEWPPGLTTSVPGTSVTQTRVLPARTRDTIARLQERVHGELPNITLPTLLMHVRGHSALSPEDVRYVLERLDTSHKRIEWLDSHSEDGDHDWERIAQTAFAFFRNYFQ